VGSFFLRGRRRVRTPEQIAMETLRLCCVDPRRVPRDVVEAHLELARRREAYTEMDAEFVAATRSLMTVLGARRRYLRILRSIRRPVLLLHGDGDRLVSVRTARRVAAMNPGWRYEEARDIGHIPMLEAPAWTLRTIEDWLPEVTAGARPGTAADPMPAARPDAAELPPRTPR
jgi:pimeloyl-ACP methyl ester carboxylesterase